MTQAQEKQFFHMRTLPQTLKISGISAFAAKTMLSSSALALSVAIGAVLVGAPASAADYSASGTAISIIDGLAVSKPVGLPAPGGTATLGSDDTVTGTGSGTYNLIDVAGATSGLLVNGSVLESSAQYISDGELASVIRARGGSTVTLNGATVTSTGAGYARGFFASGATINASGTAISTTGTESDAVHAYRGGQIALVGGTVTTFGNISHGLYSEKTDNSPLPGLAALIRAEGVTITTAGTDSWGAFAEDGGAIALIDGSIATTGLRGHGVVAGESSRVDVTGTSITTSGNYAYGLYADPSLGKYAPNGVNATIVATDVNIETNGLWSHGAYAKSADANEPARIELTGGSIRTLNETGRDAQDGDGSRSYAIFADGAGASITADGTAIETLGQRAYGAYALSGGQIELNNLSITTNGFMAYGVYASGAGSVITANNVNVTTNGSVGDAAWAYQGGHLVLNGGSYQAIGSATPGPDGELVTGFVATGGMNGVNNGVIDASGVTVLTTGENAIGLRAGSPIYNGTGYDNTSGTINLVDSKVTSRGANSTVAEVSFGSQLTVTGSTLISEQGVGIRTVDDATVVLNGTRLAAGAESFVAELETAGRSQSITVGAGSTITENNGTLLRVARSTDGADGIVTLTLAAGSNTKGDILDEDARTTGGTDVTLETGANWSGQTRGVRNFSGALGQIAFEGPADIAGDLAGDSTAISFAPEGGTIGGNLILTNASNTSGGSIGTPVQVGGSVSVDQTSRMGGNWAIAGDLTNAGTLTPGNSIGLVTIAGDLTLASSSVYAVEIDAAGNADRVDVGGTALLDGAVTVTPLGGYLLGSPYTILTAGDLAGTTFTGVSFSGDYDFLDAALSYDPNAVYVTVQRNGRTYVSVAATANERAVAGALDSLAFTSPLGQALALSSTETAGAAFGQLSGEVHASIRSALIEDSRHIRSAMSDRITRSEGEEGLAVWTAGFGSWGKHDGDTGIASMDRDTRGILVGIDTALGTQGRVGVLGGHSTSDLDSARGSADVKSNHVGVYGGFQFGGFGLQAGAAYSWHEIDTNRAVAFNGFSDALTASYDAATTQVFGDISYAIPVGTGSVEPFGNLAYVHLNTDGFGETGGAAALSAGREKSNVTFSTLGVRVATADLLGQPGVSVRGSAGWRHAFNDRLPTAQLAFAGSSPFTVAGTPLSKDAAVLDIGIDAALSQNATIGLGYSGQIGDNGVDNGVKASLAFRF